MIKFIILFVIVLFISACGDRDEGKVSKGHRDAIKEFGTNIHHRKSFRLLPNQNTLF